MRLFFALSIILFTCACGVKPGNVEPPAGSENTNFPRTYPTQ
ncbi:MAG: hypothetical protein AAF182_02585 [Pseudomonadota bacterium]